MMKKFMTLALALCLLAAFAAGCGNSGNTGSTDTPTAQNVTALEVLENTWAKFPAEEQFPIFGGCFETHVQRMEADETYMPESKPESFDLENFRELLAYSLYLPEDVLASVTDAASMTNSFNANNFTAGVITLAEGTDVKALADTMAGVLQNNMWICGMPEQLLVTPVGQNSLLIAFGVNDAMNPFVTHFKAAYPEVTILHNDPIAG